MIDKETKLARVRELFIKLKLAHDWMEKNPNKKAEAEGLIKRSEPIVDELKGLGVNKQFSYVLLIFGVPVPEILRVATS